MTSEKSCGVPVKHKRCGMPAIGRGNIEWPIHVCPSHWQVMKHCGFDPRSYGELAQLAQALKEARQ